MKMMGFLGSAMLIWAIALASNTNAAAKDNTNEQIENLEKGLVDAGNNADVAKIMTFYDPSNELLVFDIVPPREYRGAAAWRKHIEDLAPDFNGKTELIDLKVNADANLAFASSIQHFTGKAKDGTPIDLTTRVTDCLQKKQGRWMIVHQHISAPIDFATGKADLQSKP